MRTLGNRSKWKEQTVLSQTGLMLLALQPLFPAILFICKILRNALSTLWVSFMAFSFPLLSKMQSQLLTALEEKRVPWPHGLMTPWPCDPMHEPVCVYALGCVCSCAHARECREHGSCLLPNKSAPQFHN